MKKCLKYFPICNLLKLLAKDAARWGQTDVSWARKRFRSQSFCDNCCDNFKFLIITLIYFSMNVRKTRKLVLFTIVSEQMKNKNFKAVIIEPFRFEANLRFKNYSLVLKIPKQQKQILPIGNERTIGSIRASSSNSYIVMDRTIVGFCTLAVWTKTLISLLLSSTSDSAVESV